MTPIKTTIRRMTFEEAAHAGLHGNGFIIEYQGKSYNLKAGSRDNINVFTKSIGLYALTINLQLGYVGLDTYLPPEPDPINTIFLHTEYRIVDALGRNWKHLLPRTITTRLMNYTPYERRCYQP